MRRDSLLDGLTAMSEISRGLAGGYEANPPEIYGDYKLSVQDDTRIAHASPGVSAEIAIFYKGEWLIAQNFPVELQPFAELWDNYDDPDLTNADTDVASYVPLETIDKIREVLRGLS